MLKLIKIELYKIFRKWRTYIGFIAVSIIAILVQLAMGLGGAEQQIEYMTRDLQDTFYFVGNFFNGYFIAYIVLQSLYVQIPFLIVLVGGDLLAGEATAGTYRMLVTRPVSRFQIVTSKIIAGYIYSLALIFWLVIMSLVLSIIIFGTGELLVFKDVLIVLSSNDILWRFLLAYFFAGLSMCVVFSLSFLFSSLVENAIGPIVATMAVIIVFLILSVIPVDSINNIKPMLFTTHMTTWNEFFNSPVNYSEIFKSILVLVFHCVGLYALTLYIFNKKDILS
ncbi:MAG: ABC transporter permease subunit [Ignavibacteriales bacterium]|nr:ABC transporter permease subunit [Ignavibacteriales bacterium]